MMWFFARVLAGLLILSPRFNLAYDYFEPEVITELSKEQGLFECPTKHHYKRVCNTFSPYPCVCGSTSKSIQTDPNACNPKPFDDTLLARITINDVVRSYRNIEERLLMVFGNSRLNTSDNELRLGVINRNIKVVSALCNLKNLIELDVAFPATGINKKLPTSMVFEQMNYNLTKILKNQVLLIMNVRIRLSNSVNYYEPFDKEENGVVIPVKGATEYGHDPLPFSTMLLMITGFAVAVAIFLLCRMMVLRFRLVFVSFEL